MNLTERYSINKRSEIIDRKKRLRNQMIEDQGTLGVSTAGLSMYYGISPDKLLDLYSYRIDDERELYKYENIIFGE